MVGLVAGNRRKARSNRRLVCDHFRRRVGIGNRRKDQRVIFGRDSEVADLSNRDRVLDRLQRAAHVNAADRRGDYELVLRENRHRELVQAYLASITFGDALIGRLLDALDTSPAAKNTLIVLWSDHGWHLGEKQRLHKFTLWERSTRIPLIIAAPGVTRPGSRTARPVGTIDLFPTLNELCSLPAIAALDGISLVPLLKNPSLEWTRPALTTHGQGNHALRSERWRYIRYADDGEEL